MSRLAAKLVKAIFEVGSLRISDLAQAMSGTSPDADYKGHPATLKRGRPQGTTFAPLRRRGPVLHRECNRGRATLCQKNQLCGQAFKLDIKHMVPHVQFTLSFWCPVLGRPYYAGRAAAEGGACVCYLEKTPQSGYDLP